MNNQLNVPVGEGLPEWESGECFSPEWLLKVPASEVSAFLREAGFDPDKELASEIKQVIKDNRQRARRLATGASKIAWYYSDTSIFVGQAILTMLMCAIALTLLNTAFHRALFLCVASIVVWGSCAFKHDIYAKTTTRKMIVAMLLITILWGGGILIARQGELGSKTDSLAQKDAAQPPASSQVSATRNPEGQERPATAAQPDRTRAPLPASFKPVSAGNQVAASGGAKATPSSPTPEPARPVTARTSDIIPTPKDKAPTEGTTNRSNPSPGRKNVLMTGAKNTVKFLTYEAGGTDDPNAPFKCIARYI